MKTKKLMLGLGLGVSLLGNFAAHAQSGIQGIIVEKYYRANAADAADGTDPVAAGTETYRIFVDLAPGWELQAVYGDATHTLSLSTTTGFWNNSQRDAYLGDNPSAQLKNSTVALDSWISMGAAAAGNLGVLKAEDNGAANLITAGGHVPSTELVNAPASIGLALTAQDGIIAGTVPAITIAGITAELQASFQSGNANGVNFTTNNGAWSTTAVDTGATSSNKVLIAQLTTNGVVSFMLNLQVKNINTNVVEKWVPNNPQSGEFALSALSQSGIGAPPTVSITSPANAASFYVNLSPVTINATAADADGSVASVQFFLDGVSKGTDNSSPYASSTFSITTAGNHTLTAVATDDDGNTTTSSNVVVSAAVNAAPTVTITAPTAGTHFTGDSAGVVAADVVAMTAGAADSDGSVDSVAFFVNGVRVGSDATSPYAFSWQIPNGVYNAKTLTAVAYDNAGGQGTSSAVNIIIDNINAKPYFVSVTDTTCVNSSFCLPISAKDTVKNVIGFDFVLHYQKTKVAPTGAITVAGGLINSSYVTTSNSINSANGTMNISISLNNTAPNNTFFNGVGELVCVQFNKTAGFNSIDTALFSIDSIVESRYTGVASILVDPGKFITHRDSTFHGSLVFWADNSPIKYDASNAASYLKTSIVGNNASCNAPLTLTVTPDLSGNFAYAVNQSNVSSLTFNFNRDVNSAASVQSVVNGFDALQARKVLLKDPSFVPTVFQIVAMDVNQDGVISAGDITQINQRSVLLIPEFKQAWNYNAAGVNVAGKPSKDWVFIDGTTLSTDGAYVVSSVYPNADGAGFSRDNVPVIPTCLAAPVSNASNCPVISNETYTGIMLGDVNGNYKNITNDGILRSDAVNRIIIDLTKAVANGNDEIVPVTFTSAEAVNALDLAVVSEASLSSAAAYVDALSNYNSNDGTLRITSNSMQNYDSNKPVLFLQVPASTEAAALRSATTGYLNGDKATVVVIGAEDANANTPNNPSASVTNSTFASAYPNPASELLNVVTSEDATVELFDMNGSVVFTTSVSANHVQAISTANIAGGVYTLKVYNATTISIEKVVIAK